MVVDVVVVVVDVPSTFVCVVVLVVVLEPSPFVTVLEVVLSLVLSVEVGLSAVGGTLVPSPGVTQTV